MPYGRGSGADAATNHRPSNQAPGYPPRLNRLHPSGADHSLDDTDYNLNAYR